MNERKMLNSNMEEYEKISVIGLGYVGLPLAVAFSEKVEVIGFDINKEKIDAFKNGHDITKQVGDQKLAKSSVFFTTDPSELRKAKFHIVAVPTPITKNYTPDLKPLKYASKIIGQNLTKGSIVVYESTVYPGVTEGICVPILQDESGLKCGVDFKIGYSPERINPGDKLHTVDKIRKIVSGIDKESQEIIANVYRLIVTAGVFTTSSIKVAEVAKIIENCQRDLNIAFMNELSIILHKLEIDTNEVLDAASTKWNFLRFSPGLVGGHCISVDPYYLTYHMQEIGYYPQLILSGRNINNNMSKYIAENTVKQLIKAGHQINSSKVLIMGVTFKENVPDIRNSKVIDIVKELLDYGIETYVTDPIADPYEVKDEYQLELVDIRDVRNVNAVILAVPHNEYKQISLNNLKEIFVDGEPVLIDVKGIMSKDEAKTLNYTYWRL